MPVNIIRQLAVTTAVAMAFTTALAAGLAGPAAAKEAKSSYVYGSPPEWGRYKELAEQAIRPTMFDPEAARFQWPRGYRQASYKALLSPRVYGYVTCGLVNGRNRFGGYVGESWFIVVIDHDTVLYSELGKSDGGMIADLCVKARLPAPPVEAAAALSSPAAPAAVAAVNQFGLEVMEVPDGAYVRAITAGGRAEQAGLRPGMVIVRINGIALKGMNMGAISALVGGISGTANLEMASGNTVKVTAP